MRTISLREFQRNASQYIGEMVELTQYDKVIGTFIPTILGTPPKVSTLPENVSTDEKKVSTQSVNRNYCRFCGNRGATPHPYQYEDGSGEGEAFFCDSCWKKYQEAHESRIGDYQVRGGQVQNQTVFRGSFPKPVKKKKGERA